MIHQVLFSFFLFFSFYISNEIPLLSVLIPSSSHFLKFTIGGIITRLDMEESYKSKVAHSLRIKSLNVLWNLRFHFFITLFLVCARFKSSLLHYKTTFWDFVLPFLSPCYFTIFFVRIQQYLCK